MEAADLRLAQLLTLRAQRDGVWAPGPLPRGSLLHAQGAVHDGLFVLEAGLVKLTYLTDNGDEWIKSLIADRGLFGGFAPQPQPSRFGAVAIEPVRVAELPGAWLRTVLARDPALAAASAQFFVWLAERKQVREEALLCQSAEQRYCQIIAQEPDLVRRLPQGDIARYLRITPVAFSRIKRRLGLGAQATTSR
ncbi:MAG: Crp/Fnr family transcriptional regulator [Novosphingobium sp.]|jgi:CRP-like cAMP-binding protein|nr:Crp/Fnr family transcriptional regulator [Novosphingobium sp.]